MDDDSSNLLVDEDARRRFESSWQSGQPALIEQCLPPADHPLFLGTLLELVHIDLEMSWKRGAYETANPPRVESYLARFPQLASGAAVRSLLGQEYRIRHQLGGKPAMSDYQARFRALFEETLSFVDTIDSPDSLDSAAAPIAPAADNLPHINGYKVLSLLGSGGMGHVFRAVQLGTRREVALKLMRRSFSKRGHFRFDREVQLTARLDHPNIARIFDSGLQQDVCYYAMELIIGKPLDHFVAESRMGEKQILGIFQSICLAIAHAHVRGVIHRDLKPSNIIVAADGRPHVVDFGLAKTILAEELQGDRSHVEATVDGELAGTPAFMSPEQAAAKVDLDTRTDVYSLGVILYSLLTGQFPHNVDDNYVAVLNRICHEEIRRPRLAKPELDPELESLLLKALAKSPDERYASAGELARDVENYLRGEPLTARPATTVYFLRKRLWKYRVPLAMAAGIAIALAATAIAVTAKIIHERNVAVAADRRSTIKAAEALAEKRLARLSEAAALIALGDQLGSQKSWSEAKANYRNAYDKLKAESAWAGPADIGLWNACRASPPPLWEISGSKGGITDVALSADGRIALTAAQNGSVEAWDMTTGCSRGKFAGHRGRAWSVAITADAKTGFSGGADGIIKIWDLQPNARGGNQLGQVSGWVTAIGLSADENKIASVSGETEASIVSPRDYTITIWPAKGGPAAKPVCSFTAAGRVTRVLFSPDGSVLLTAGEELAAWDVSDGRKIGVFGDRAAGINAAVFSPDGAQICAGDTEGVLKLWDFKPAKLAFSCKAHESSINAVKLSNGGKTLISAGEDNSLRFRDAASGEVIRECTANRRPARCFSFSADGRFGLAAAADGDTLTLWPLFAPAESITFEPAASPCDSVALFTGDQLALCGTRDGLVIYDIATGHVIRTPRFHSARAEAWAFSRDSRRIASVSGRELRVWEFPSMRELNVPINRKGHQSPAIALSPDGSLLLLAPGGSGLSLRDAQTGKEIHSLNGHGDAVSSVAFSPDGKLAVSGGRDGAAILWDVSTGKELRRFIGHKDGINAIAFAPDGLTVVTASGNSALEMGRDDYSVRRWNVATAAPIQTFLGHASRIRAVACSPDGALIASAGDDRQIKLWQVATGRELRNILSANSPIHCLAFSASGTLISGGEDGVTRLWDFPTSAKRREQEPRVASAIQTLQRHPTDPAALSALGQWYTFHRAWDWAGATLQRAAAAGAETDSLTLARCHWMTGQFARATAEFKAAANNHKIPADYTAICIEAIAAELTPDRDAKRPTGK